MLRPPDPVLVLDLFPDERHELLALLDALPPDAWSLPSLAGEWTVKDVAAHLVADDLGRLSRQGDGDRESPVAIEDLKAYIDRRNAEWVTSMRRISPRVIRSLLHSVAMRRRHSSRRWIRMRSETLSPGPDPTPRRTGLTSRASSPSAGITSNRSETPSAHARSTIPSSSDPPWQRSHSP
jgi:hypothetical protein